MYHTSVCTCVSNGHVHMITILVYVHVLAMDMYTHDNYTSVCTCVSNGHVHMITILVYVHVLAMDMYT